MSFTASFCPAVSGPLLRCPWTCQPRIGARPRAWPPRISATASRSLADGAVGGERGPPRRADRRRAAFRPSPAPRLPPPRPPIATAPGAWASAAASRSVRENTASRSERCAIAQAAASAAGEGGRTSVPVSRPGGRTGWPAGSRSLARAFAAGASGCRPPAISSSARTAGVGAIRCPVSGSGDASRPGRADLSAAAATSAPVSRPMSAACFCQTSRNSSRSMSRFAARVISAARSASPGLSADSPRPRSAIAASISARRVEKASMASRDTPAISKRPSAWVFSMA